MIININPKARLTPEALVHLNEAVNALANPVNYLAIDPGTSNGVCGYDVKLYPMFMMTVSADDMVMFLHQFNLVKKCILESYHIFPNKAKDHIYSDLETPRVIGRVESWAEIKKVDLIKQPSSIKPTGYKWIGKKPLPKSNPRNHSLDAHVHFMYWAVRANKIPLEDLIKKDR